MERRGAMHPALASFAAIVVISATSAQVTSFQTQGEVVVEGGMQLPSPLDLDKFFANIDLAFVGVAERVSVQFIGEDSGHPYTCMTFRPTETIKGSLPSSFGTIDVWTYGGSYVDRPTGRQVLNPAGIARGIQVGASYFVPVTHLNVPQLDGKYVLAADDAIVQIDGPHVSALYFFKTWVNGVIANGRALFTAPGPAPDDAILFLSALRSAASR